MTLLGAIPWRPGRIRSHPRPRERDHRIDNDPPSQKNAGFHAFNYVRRWTHSSAGAVDRVRAFLDELDALVVASRVVGVGTRGSARCDDRTARVRRGTRWDGELNARRTLELVRDGYIDLFFLGIERGVLECFECRSVLARASNSLGLAGMRSLAERRKSAFGTKSSQCWRSY